MIENAARQGEYLMGCLERIESPHIKEVRGKGLLIGVELHPEAGGARQYCEALMKRGLLCKETHQNVIRIAPPLVIKKDEVDWAMEQFEAVLA
jgi:ornithine--oxo-acid transaminase